MTDEIPILAQCAICSRFRGDVPKLVKVHRLYMCSDCCTDAMKLVDEDAVLGDKANIKGSDDDDVQYAQNNVGQPPVMGRYNPLHQKWGYYPTQAKAGGSKPYGYSSLLGKPSGN